MPTNLDLAKVKEIRQNVIAGIRTKADLRRCGCPECQHVIKSMGLKPKKGRYC